MPVATVYQPASGISLFNYEGCEVLNINRFAFNSAYIIPFFTYYFKDIMEFLLSISAKILPVWKWAILKEGKSREVTLP